MNTSITVDRPETPPGDLAIWLFIVAELLVFAVFFASYALTRASHVELFNQWQSPLDRNLAPINTPPLGGSVGLAFYISAKHADINYEQIEPNCR